MDINIKNIINFLFLNILIFILILPFMSIYQFSYFLLIAWIIVLKKKNYLKNKLNLLIAILLVFVYIYEIMSSSPTRAAIHKNIFYSCYSLQHIDKHNMLSLEKLLGNKDIMVRQIIDCKIENYDSFLLNNMSEDTHDEFLTKGRSSKTASHIYGYLTQKYDISPKYRRGHYKKLLYL